MGSAGGRKARQGGYVLRHLPESLDWRARRAKPHPSKRRSDPLFTQTCVRAGSDRGPGLILQTSIRRHGAAA